MRKLATIRTIDEIRSIPDADAIECAVVGGERALRSPFFGCLWQNYLF